MAMRSWKEAKGPAGSVWCVGSAACALIVALAGCGDGSAARGPDDGADAGGDTAAAEPDGADVSSDVGPVPHDAADTGGETQDDAVEEAETDTRTDGGPRPDGGAQPDADTDDTANCEAEDTCEVEPDLGFRVVETSPPDGGELAQAEQQIRARFSRPLDEASITPDTLRVLLLDGLLPEGEAKDDDDEDAPPETDEPVWYAVEFDATLEDGGRSLRFDLWDVPEGPGSVRVELDGVRDTSGESLTFAWQFSFPWVVWESVEHVHRVERSVWLGGEDYAIPVVRDYTGMFEQLDVVIARGEEPAQVIDDRPVEHVIAWDADARDGTLYLASLLPGPVADARELRVETIDLSTGARALWGSAAVDVADAVPGGFRVAAHATAAGPTLAFAWIDEGRVEIRLASSVDDMQAESWRSVFNTPVGVVPRPEGLQIAFDPEGRLHLAMAYCVSDEVPCLRTALARWRYDRGLWVGGDRVLRLPLTADSSTCDELLALDTAFDDQMRLTAAIAHRPCGDAGPPTLWLRRAAWARDWSTVVDESAFAPDSVERSYEHGIEITGVSADHVGVRFGRENRLLFIAVHEDFGETYASTRWLPRGLFGREAARLYSTRQPRLSTRPFFIAHDPHDERLELGRPNPRYD